MNHQTIDRQKRLCFEEVYKKYKHAVLVYAKRNMALSETDAEDVVSEAFLKLFEIWQDFESETYSVVLFWLMKTIRFLTYSKRKREMRMPTVSFEEIGNDDIDIEIEIEMQSFFIDESVYREKLQRIKSNLSAEEYRLFEEIVLKRRDILRIAEKENININTLYSQWRRLRMKIKKILQ